MLLIDYLKFSLTSLHRVKRPNTDIIQLTKLPISLNIVRTILSRTHHLPFKFKTLPVLGKIAPNLLVVMVSSD